MTTATADGALYRLMSWFSPAYPVGAFSHSHGLEWAVERGWVHDRPSLVDWLHDLLTSGGGWSDAVLLAHAHGAARRTDKAALARLVELGGALCPSRERRVETLAQGAAFLAVSRQSWPVPSLTLIEEAADDGVCYPVAVGVLAAGHGIGPAAVLHAYLHAFSGNLVSAAQRLVPLGQTDGQKAIAALMPVCAGAALRAAALDLSADPLDEMGAFTIASDIASMRHETQHTRLFRT